MLRRRQKGWLGIDIGSASVKVAQLARSAAGIQVLARSMVPRSLATNTPDEEQDAEKLWSACGEIRTAISLDHGFRGRQAAAAMPMGLCEVHQLDNLALEEAGLDAVVRRAIGAVTQCSTDHLEFDIWPAEAMNVTAAQRWNVLAVARPWSDQIYQDVATSSLSCRTIDGLPHALARAIKLTAQDQALPPIAALDWGFGQATLCIVTEGRPVYVRALKDCSLERTLSGIAQELAVTTAEALLLLQTHGIHRQASDGNEEVTSLLAELTTEPLRQLEQELARTISHIGFQRKAIAPQQLLLFGGGALTRGLARHLRQRLHLETKVWSLGENHPAASPEDCVYGTAMALSALAWEDS
jgi:Tfp pilus assembly PilM family ATPase